MRDTSPEAEAVALAAIRRRPPIERMREALELSETLRATALVSLRHQYPADSIIQLVERMTGESLGAGSPYWAGAPPVSLERLLRVLTDALGATSIPFMLTGSVAAAFRGASRATMDVDMVIDPTAPQLDQFVQRVESLGLPT